MKNRKTTNVKDRKHTETQGGLKVYSHGSCTLGTLGLTEQHQETENPLQITTTPPISFKNVFTSQNCTALLSIDNHLYTCGDMYSGIIARSTPSSTSTTNTNSKQQLKQQKEDEYTPGLVQFEEDKYKEVSIKSVTIGTNHMLVLLDDKRHTLLGSGSFMADKYMGLTIHAKNKDLDISIDNFKLLETSDKLTKINTSFVSGFKADKMASGTQFAILAQRNSVYSIGVLPTEHDYLMSLDFDTSFLGVKKSKRYEKFGIRIKPFFKSSKWGKLKQIECGQESVYLLYSSGEIAVYGANYQSQLGLPNGLNNGVHFIKNVKSIFELQANYIVNNKISNKLLKVNVLIDMLNNEKASLEINGSGKSIIIENEKLKSELDLKINKLVLLKFIKANTIKIAGGKEHLLVLLRNGQVYSLGINSNLCLGRETKVQSETYMESDHEFGKVDFLDNFGADAKIVDICAGEQNSFFLTNKQDILTCGNPNLASKENNTNDIKKISLGKDVEGKKVFKMVASDYSLKFMAM